MASCTLSGLLAILIAESLDPVAYLVNGGPSPLLLIGAGVLLPEPVDCSGSFDAGACDSSAGRSVGESHVYRSRG
jgi:hypothetical protein